MTRFITFFTGAFICMALLGGCQSIPELPEASKAPVREVASDLEAGSNRLAQTMDSLHTVMRGNTNMHTAANDYYSNLSLLDQAVNKARGNARQIGDASTVFEHMKLDMRDVSVSQSNVEATERALQTLNKQIDELGETFRPLYSDMWEISNALTDNPTSAKAASLRPEIQSVLNRESAVQKKIDVVQQTLSKLLGQE